MQSQNVTSVNALHAIYIDRMVVQIDTYGATLLLGHSLKGKNVFDFMFGMSPQHMKSMAEILNNQIKAYEKVYGKIPLTPQMKKEIEKGKIGFDLEGFTDKKPVEPDEKTKNGGVKIKITKSKTKTAKK